MTDNDRRCLDCPVADAITATVRMLAHRGCQWEPMDPAAVDAASPWLSALVSSHTRAHHAVAVAGTGSSAFLRVTGMVGCLVVVSDTEKLSASCVKQATNRAFSVETGIRRLQLVSAVPPNAQTLRLLPSTVSVVPWTLALTYPLDHEIVPPQRRATTDDLRAAGLADLKRSLLPSIRCDDAIVRYLDLVPGDVLCIDRLDGSRYFRRVVA
jgi:DNA-directed RNA polymerase subunit H (RpoH/RPB5)